MKLHFETIMVNKNGTVSTEDNKKFKVNKTLKSKLKAGKIYKVKVINVTSGTITSMEGVEEVYEY